MLPHLDGEQSRGLSRRGTLADRPQHSGRGWWRLPLPAKGAACPAPGLASAVPQNRQLGL